VLHTYFTDETTARCVRTVKDAAEQAGRDPDDVKVWSCFATVGRQGSMKPVAGRTREPEGMIGM